MCVRCANTTNYFSVRAPETPPCILLSHNGDLLHLVLQKKDGKLFEILSNSFLVLANRRDLEIRKTCGLEWTSHTAKGDLMFQI